MSIVVENEYRKYDFAKHRFSITPAYILDTFGVDIMSMSSIREDVNPQTAAQRFLDMVCSQMAYYIYEYAENRLLTEYLIATNYDGFADTFQEAAGIYAYSIYLSGNMVQFETGITLDNKVEFTKKDVSIQMMPVAARNILETGDLLFRGTRTGFDLRTIRQLKAQGEF